MSKRKNKSSNVPEGTIIQTKDQYFKGQGKYRKEGYSKKGNYRKAVVVDSNKMDELAVVKLTSSKRAKTTKNGNKYRPFILTKDNTNAPIKEGRKFLVVRKKGKIKNKISKKEANEIKKESLKDKKNGIKNRTRLRQLKGRKKR